MLLNAHYESFKKFPVARFRCVFCISVYYKRDHQYRSRFQCKALDVIEIEPCVEHGYSKNFYLQKRPALSSTYASRLLGGWSAVASFLRLPFDNTRCPLVAKNWATRPIQWICLLSLVITKEWLWVWSKAILKHSPPHSSLCYLQHTFPCPCRWPRFTTAYQCFQHSSIEKADMVTLAWCFGHIDDAILGHGRHI